MKLFRLIFILLGLYLCLHHVWCLTCGTEYDDPASKAYLAQVVIIGKIQQIFPPKMGYYNTTIKIDKKKNILKGENSVESLINGRGPRLLTLGPFGPEDPVQCVTEVEKEMEYIMFLEATSDSAFFQMSAFPVPASSKRNFKKARREIKKILCSKGNCVKTPVINPRKMKDRELEEGDKIDLSCRMKGKPFPLPHIQWLKDGRNISIAIPRAKIKDGKRGSRLQVRKVTASDAGTYTCVAKNVGGEVRQDAVISVKGSELGEMPVVGEPALEDVSQDIQKRLKLVCKIKKPTIPKTRFKWFKDGKEIKTGSKPGLVIRSKSDESRLQINELFQSHEGVYECIAENKVGSVVQKSNVSVTNAPPKMLPCGPEDSGYCLNNGTCNKFVALGTPFCTCQPGYEGERCMDLTFEKAQQEKLAQDRTFVVVGIISGILLFIGICVVSYFLAKRRRDRFHRRRMQRANGNIEDNIPQVYRPLIPCDDTDGHIRKMMNGVLIHKEVQTTETCFVGSTTHNLYISAFEGYEAGDRNSRSRKTAVSIDGDPRTNSTGQESDEENTEKLGGQRRERPVSSSNRHSNGLSRDGAPNDAMNDLSPKHKTMQNDNERPISAKPNVVNILSPNSQQPPVINLDSDSEEDFPPAEDLPVLHISDEEDDNDNTDYIFKKCRVKKPKSSSASSEKKQENIAPAKDNNNDKRNNANIAKDVSKGAKEPKPKIKEPPVKEKTGRTKALKQAENSTITSNSANNDSDSSTTTEGCDSPTTAWRNAQEEFSDQSPTDSPRTTWNERGSPEIARKPENVFNIFPRMESKHSNPSDRNRNEHAKSKHKNKYTISI